MNYKEIEVFERLKEFSKNLVYSKTGDYGVLYLYFGNEKDAAEFHGVLGCLQELSKVLRPCWYTSRNRGLCRKCGQTHSGIIDENGVEQPLFLANGDSE